MRRVREAERGIARGVFAQRKGSNLIDSRARNRVRQAGAERGLARGRLTDASRADVAEEELVHVLGQDTRPRDRGFDHLPVHAASRVRALIRPFRRRASGGAAEQSATARVRSHFYSFPRCAQWWGSRTVDGVMCLLCFSI